MNDLDKILARLEALEAEVFVEEEEVKEFDEEWDPLEYYYLLGRDSQSSFGPLVDNGDGTEGRPYHLGRNGKIVQIHIHPGMISKIVWYDKFDDFRFKYVAEDDVRIDLPTSEAVSYQLEDLETGILSKSMSLLT